VTDDLSDTPVVGDGVITFPEMPTKEGTMPMPDFIGAASAHTMEQTAVRFNDGSAATAITERQEFVKDLKVTNVTMLQQLEQDGLANVIMQLKASGSMPPNTVGG
jgi:hypothetical protein